MHPMPISAVAMTEGTQEMFGFDVPACVLALMMIIWACSSHSKLETYIQTKEDLLEGRWRPRSWGADAPLECTFRAC